MKYLIIFLVLCSFGFFGWTSYDEFNRLEKPIEDFYQTAKERYNDDEKSILIKDAKGAHPFEGDVFNIPFCVEYNSNKKTLLKKFPLINDLVEDFRVKKEIEEISSYKIYSVPKRHLIGKKEYFKDLSKEELESLDKNFKEFKNYYCKYKIKEVVEDMDYGVFKTVDWSSIKQETFILEYTYLKDGEEFSAVKDMGNRNAYNTFVLLDDFLKRNQSSEPVEHLFFEEKNSTCFFSPTSWKYISMKYGKILTEAVVQISSSNSLGSLLKKNWRFVCIQDETGSMKIVNITSDVSKERVLKSAIK